MEEGVESLFVVILRCDDAAWAAEEDGNGSLFSLPTQLTHEKSGETNTPGKKSTDLGVNMIVQAF